MEARVVEKPLVVDEADEGVLRPTEPGIGERQPQPVEQRVDPKGHEQREPRGQKEVRRQRSWAQKVVTSVRCVGPLTLPSPPRCGRG